MNLFATLFTDVDALTLAKEDALERAKAAEGERDKLRTERDALLARCTEESAEVVRVTVERDKERARREGVDAQVAAQAVQLTEANTVVSRIAAKHREAEAELKALEASTEAVDEERNRSLARLVAERDAALARLAPFVARVKGARGRFVKATHG